MENIMDKKRLRKLAGIREQEDWEVEEEKMMAELHPLKKQLDAIMAKYPHAEWDDVLNWLKSF